MRKVFMCSYCDYVHTKNVVAEHEKNCMKNPINVLKKKAEKEAEVEKRWIMAHCRYHKTAYDDGYDEFDACNKNGHGFGRFADDCLPCEGCKQYCI